MVEVKYDQKHHAGGTAEARIKSRLRSSSGSGQNVETHPTRTVHTIHRGGQQHKEPLYGARGEVVKK